MIYGPFETEDEARAYDPSKDWTVDPETGRSDSSPLYLSLVLEVERLIRGDAHTLIAGRAQNTARLIVSHLAHKHGLVPFRLHPVRGREVRQRGGRSRLGRTHGHAGLTMGDHDLIVPAWARKDEAEIRAWAKDHGFRVRFTDELSEKALCRARRTVLDRFSHLCTLDRGHEGVHSDGRANWLISDVSS